MVSGGGGRGGGTGGVGSYVAAVGGIRVNLMTWDLEDGGASWGGVGGRGCGGRLVEGGGGAEGTEVDRSLGATPSSAVDARVGWYCWMVI